MYSYGKTIKILAIGNSFSEDAIENYLYELGEADNINFVIGNMLIGGCSLEMHWDNVLNNTADYSYRKIVNGHRTTTKNVTLDTAILDEDWDYISFQQVSHSSGRFNTYFPYINNLTDYVASKAINPDVHFVMHMTWAYEKTATQSGFSYYMNDQMVMYNAIVETVKRASTQAGIDIVIPSGTAIQNGRTSYVGDNFCRDGAHLDLYIGRFTAACAWYEQITGNDVTKNSYQPIEVPKMHSTVAKMSAHAAVLSPYSITNIDIDAEEYKGDFLAWDATAFGNGGINADPLSFTERNMTLEFWLNIIDYKKNSTKPINIISNKHLSNYGFSVDISRNNSTNTDDLVFVFNSEILNNGSSNYEGVELDLPLNKFLNQWGHVAYVISSDTQKVYAYVNGELYDVIEDFGGLWIGNDIKKELWIARRSINSFSLSTKMADIRIWKETRTSDEIAQYYNCRLISHEDDLYLYYNFDFFDKKITNIANPTTNEGVLFPTDNWSLTHSVEVLAQKPVNLLLDNNGSLSCSIHLSIGENIVENLKKGVYIVDNQKIVVYWFKVKPTNY